MRLFPSEERKKWRIRRESFQQHPIKTTVWAWGYTYITLLAWTKNAGVLPTLRCNHWLDKSARSLHARGVCKQCQHLPIAPMRKWFYKTSYTVLGLGSARSLEIVDNHIYLEACKTLHNLKWLCIWFQYICLFISFSRRHEGISDPLAFFCTAHLPEAGFSTSSESPTTSSLVSNSLR